MSANVSCLKASYSSLLRQLQEKCWQNSWIQVLAADSEHHVLLLWQGQLEYASMHVRNSAEIYSNLNLWAGVWMGRICDNYIPGGSFQMDNLDHLAKVRGSDKQLCIHFMLQAISTQSLIVFQSSRHTEFLILRSSTAIASLWFAATIDTKIQDSCQRPNPMETLLPWQTLLSRTDQQTLQCILRFGMHLPQCILKSWFYIYIVRGKSEQIDIYFRSMASIIVLNWWFSLSCCTAHVLSRHSTITLNSALVLHSPDCQHLVLFSTNHPNITSSILPFCNLYHT